MSLSPRRSPSLGFLLLAGLAAAGLQARETLQVSDVRPLKAGNVSETFLARAGDRVWFFKQDGPTREIARYGNFEAEVLVARLLRRVGVQAPEARVVSLAGREGAYLQCELVDAGFTGGAAPVPLKEGLSSLDMTTVDGAEVQLLQLVDVLVGNGDRHDGNLFLVPSTDGRRTRVVPIDNNLALATPRVVVGYYNWHFVEGFGGVVPGRNPADPGDLLYPRHADACGRPERIMRRNGLYEEAWRATSRSPRGLGQYVQLAERLRAALPDAVLERLVGDLDDESITAGDPAARRAEILRLLKLRRDRLPDAMREMVKHSDTRPADGLRWIERVLPERLTKRLGLGERAWVFLGARLFEGERFDPREAYFHLRAAGVERLLAREVTLELCKAQGVAFPAKEVLLAEVGFQASGQAGALERFLSSYPEAKFRRLHEAGPSSAPVDLLRVLPRDQGLRLVDARGVKLHEAQARPLYRAIKAGLREGRPTPGEALVLERRAFEPGAYRATVEDAAGRARWRGEVATGKRPAPPENP